MKSSSILFVAVAAACIAAVSALPALAAGTVKIGVIYPLTGNAASAGQSAKDAVELGVEIVSDSDEAEPDWNEKLDRYRRELDALTR